MALLTVTSRGGQVSHKTLGNRGGYHCWVMLLLAAAHWGARKFGMRVAVGNVGGDRPRHASQAHGIGMTDGSYVRYAGALRANIEQQHVKPIA